MSWHLILNSMDANWRLHPTQDPHELRAKLTDPDAGVVEALVVPADLLEPTTVYVRPALVGWWTIVEVRDPDA